MTQVPEPIDPARLKYCADGWPLCPQCGHNKLYSLDLPPYPTDELTCDMCHWRGFVPAQAVNYSKEPSCRA
jgi:hypothetical protein